MYGVILIGANLATVVDMVRDGDSWFDTVSVVVVVSIGVTAIVWLYDAFGYYGTAIVPPAAVRSPTATATASSSSRSSGGRAAPTPNR